ncbi:calcineurin B homologous protein 1-like [Dysidea avara]|uniref:calcineurin B homologous protein 1-like n=1 Tax=Dysidea avara TaxID=196820 RepID=UPI0033278B7B
MGNVTSLSNDEIKEIHEETGFSASQIRRLYSRFCHLDKDGKGHLERKDLRLIPELSVNPLGNRIIEAFFVDQNDSRRPVEQVDFLQFTRTLATFRRTEAKHSSELNTVDKKIEFVFRVYDIDRDGYISKDDLIHILRCLVGVSIAEEQVKGIAHRTLREADKDEDKLISLDEFKEALGNVDVKEKMSLRFLTA